MTISVGPEARPNFNTTNIGIDRVITVSVTNNSKTVTSSAAFPANAVGYGGFTILLAGVEYVVDYVTSTSSLTLTADYAAGTASVSCTFYKWVWLQIYATHDYRPSGASYIVTASPPGSLNWYQRRGASVTNALGINYLRLPPLTLDPTIDAIPPTAKLFFHLFRPDGSPLGSLACAQAGWAIPTGTPTSYRDLCSYNSPLVSPPPNTDTYSQSEIDALFPFGAPGQGLYFRDAGRTARALTFGDGLAIDVLNGVLTASGGTLAPRTITTSGALLSSDQVVLLDCTAAPITLSLPAVASVPNKFFYIQKIDASANAGTLDPNGAETINGAATFSVSIQWQGVFLYCDGITWHVILDYSPAVTVTPAIRTISATTTILTSDETVLINTGAGTVTANLFTAVGNSGKVLTFKKITSDVNLAVIEPAGAEQIDLFTTWALALAQETVSIRSNGTQWYRVGD